MQLPRTAVFRRLAIPIVGFRSGHPDRFANRDVDDPLEIVSAVCRDDHGIPDCLVPELKRPHGSRFQNVCFLRKDVLARFPALQATLATARKESEAVEAFSGYVTDHTTRPDAETWLRERGFNLGPRAFQRVWREARE